MYDVSAAQLHPAIQERPWDIAKLCVYRAEIADLEVISNPHGPTEIVKIDHLRLIRASMIYVLCKDEQTARGLRDAWGTYEHTSPHRPRTEAEISAWSEELNPYPNVPRDWTF